MAWSVEYTDEFESWWVSLDEEEQIDIDAVVGLLEEKGPHLPFPFSSDVKGVKYRAIRALRVQHRKTVQNPLCFRSPPNGHPAYRRQKDRRRALVRTIRAVGRKNL